MKVNIKMDELSLELFKLTKNERRLIYASDPEDENFGELMTDLNLFHDWLAGYCYSDNFDERMRDGEAADLFAPYFNESLDRFNAWIPVIRDEYPFVAGFASSVIMMCLVMRAQARDVIRDGSLSP